MDIKDSVGKRFKRKDQISRGILKLKVLDYIKPDNRLIVQVLELGIVSHGGWQVGEVWDDFHAPDLLENWELVDETTPTAGSFTIGIVPQISFDRESGSDIEAYDHDILDKGRGMI